MAVRLMLAALLISGAWGASCPDDADTDLCETSSEAISYAVRDTGLSPVVLLLAGALAGRGEKFPAGLFLVLPLSLSLLTAEAGAATSAATDGTCGSVKALYKKQECCGSPAKSFPYQIVPNPATRLIKSKNFCNAKKPATGFDNKNCTTEKGVIQALEQAGTNVTLGYAGEMNTSATPITTSYFEAGLCPVNVHWHLGAEHLSVGEFDEAGTGPDAAGGRRLAANARQGLQCHKYNKNDAKFTKTYEWKHCVNMVVGQTYEVHWPHSAAGACGTPYQYQTPFYDGVFCRDGKISITHQHIGVQSQVFTIVNDEAYYYPELMRGMIIDGDYGKDIAKYTGSTTGTSRNNVICSSYTPITWQVDRKCQLISASSFDKMCADMKQQADDMSGDLYAHGARELVANKLAANNHKL